MTARTLMLSLLLLQTSHSVTITIASAQAPPLKVANNEELVRGVELYKQRKFSEASKVLQNAVKKNKTDDEAWFHLGLALLAQPKKTKNAAQAFETAIKLRPKFAAAHTGLAYTLLRRNKSSEAIREARVALSLDSSSADAHYIVGIVRLNSGDPQEALTEAREASRLNPEFTSAYLLKSQALVSVYAERALGARRFTRTSSPPQTPEQRAERRRGRLEATALLQEAAESIKTYLKLNPSDSAAKLWREQLATLEFYGRYPGDKENLDDAPVSGDDVTTKARVMGKPEPAYTESARQAQVSGTVVLHAVFASDSQVRHILVLNGLPNGLTEAALRAARQIKFVPATIDGRPVSTFVQLEYYFNLY